MAQEDKQQEQILAQLMQEVAEKSQKQKVSESISTIEAARIQSRNKKIQVGFTLLALLVSTYFIFRFSMLGTAGWPDWSPFVTEQANSTDADTPDKITAPANTATLLDKGVVNPAVAENPQPANRTTSLQARIPVNSAAMTKKDFELHLTSYYHTLQAKNLDQVQNYYAPPLTRFFNEYGVTADRLEELLSQAWKRTPEDRHEILWDTFRFYKDEKDNYIMDFYVNYQYRRAGKQDWQQQKLYTMIKMNKDLKIFYITGD